MGSAIFGIASLGSHIELYFFEAGANNGFQGWFRQDVMPSLAASPEPLVIGMEPGRIAEMWAPHFRDRGHSVYVVPAPASEAEADAPASSAKAICQAAVLMHTDSAARC